MASSTRHGGASYTEAELADPAPPTVIIRRAEIGYVDRAPEPDPVQEVTSSPQEAGGGSTPSGEKLPTERDKPKAPARKLARTTANRSKRTEQTSDADSTDGNGRETETDSHESDDDDFSDFE